MSGLTVSAPHANAPGQTRGASTNPQSTSHGTCRGSAPRRRVLHEVPHHPPSPVAPASQIVKLRLGVHLQQVADPHILQHNRRSTRPSPLRQPESRLHGVTGPPPRPPSPLLRV